MASNPSTRPSGNGPSGRKRQWFARRQVYLRTGQDSQYVELSPLLQIGVAVGFGALALWLIGASYTAATSFFDENNEAALLARLGSTEQALGAVERERDAARQEAARAADLEAALTDARVSLAEAPLENGTDTAALTAELEQTRAQLDELHLRLSESKADQAALQARFEAETLASTDSDDRTAEEAASLHDQLEDAFEDIETAEKERDEATAKLAALTEDAIAKDEATERNTALLKAATAEIERLQETVETVETRAEESITDYQSTIEALEEKLGDAVAARDELEREVADLGADLEQARTASLDAATTSEAADTEARTAFDAELQAQAIDAELEEAELLATIDDLRAELSAASNDAPDGDVAVRDSAEVQSLRQRVNVAEAEIERLILSGLKANDDPAQTPVPADTGGDPAEAQLLRSELLTAQADIIKLNADVRAARKRLADEAETEDGQTAKPDNSAKLEQQLASTRSRVQQLNKALADAKLREVAIDLALINVVPTPSPPAPR